MIFSIVGSENIKLPSKSESTIHTEHKPLNNSDIFLNTSSSTSNYPTLHPGSISKNKTTILTGQLHIFLC